MPIEANWDHNYTNDCIPNFSSNMELPRHRWYEFKEGYGATLVERAILDTRTYKKRSELNVLDPFSGSGTTPLTALNNNCNAVSIEVNPFMSFVGKTKCIKQINNFEDYHKILEYIMAQNPKEQDSPLENLSSFSFGEKKTKWLFNRSVLRGFEALKNSIKNVENSEVFLLALFSAVMECCNAQKDGKCLRYRKNWNTLALSSQELRSIFYKNCQNAINDLNIIPLKSGNRTFIEGGSQQALKTFENNAIDLTVFSPPYLNTFDYSDIYRPELFLGEFVNNNEELRLIRKETLRSHVQYKWNTIDKPQSIWARNIAELVNEKKDTLWNKDIPNMIDAYFYDMESIIKELYRISSNGAQMWFTVATSAYAGIEIPVDLILADIATKQGWRLLNVNALRKLRTSSQCKNENGDKIRLRESLVICQK